MKINKIIINENNGIYKRAVAFIYYSNGIIKKKYFSSNFKKGKTYYDSSNYLTKILYEKKNNKINFKNINSKNLEYSFLYYSDNNEENINFFKNNIDIEINEIIVNLKKNNIIKLI